MNIGALPTRNARYRSDHLALICEDEQYTWAAFNARINRCANMLAALGVGKGDKLASLLGNCVELLEVYWAAAKLGAVVVPLSPLLRPSGVASLLRDSDAIAIVTTRALAESLADVRDEFPAVTAQRILVIDRDAPGDFGDYHARCAQASPDEPPPVAIDEDDPYNIIYSSGTTGTPKGIVLSHRARVMYCVLFASCYRMTPESVVLHAGSLVFNGAFLTLMPWMYLGATYVLMRQYRSGAFIAAVSQHEVSHVIMVPSQIIAALNDPAFSAEALASLDMLGTVGAPLHEQHKRSLHERLPGRLYELYGLTEGFMTHLDRTDVPDKLTSVGAPLPLSEMRIVDGDGNSLPPGQPGEIVGRGPLLMSHYYNRPDLTRAAIVDGWLHSGDVGYTDDDGFLYLVDRQKDLIISGGVNVYPRDIEEVAARHDSVREVAVFGVPSAKWGETPVAAIVLKHGHDADADELRRWINDRVAAKFQRVSQVLVVDDLPRGVTGKVLKRALRAQHGERS